MHPQVSTGCIPLPNSLLLSAPSWSDLPTVTGRGRGEKEREGEGEGEEGWEEEGVVERMFDPVWSWTQLSYLFLKKKLTLYICFVLLLSVLVFKTSNCHHPASSKLCVCVSVCMCVCMCAQMYICVHVCVYSGASVWWQMCVCQYCVFLVSVVFNLSMKCTRLGLIWERVLWDPTIIIIINGGPGLNPPHPPPHPTPCPHHKYAC